MNRWWAITSEKQVIADIGKLIGRDKESHHFDHIILTHYHENSLESFLLFRMAA